MYHPPQEIRSEELSKHLQAGELSITAKDSSHEASESPQSDESRITTKSLSQEFTEQVQTNESSATIKSRSQIISESSRPDEPSNILENSSEGFTNVAQAVDEFGEPGEYFQELGLDLEHHRFEESQEENSEVQHHL